MKSDVFGVRPVFVVGAPRSGTTLMQLLIASQDNFFSVPETRFFLYGMRPFLKTKKHGLSYNDVVIIIDRLTHSESNTLRNEECINRLKYTSLLYDGEYPSLAVCDALKQRMLDSIKKRPISVASVCDCVVRMLANINDVNQRWVEKTPKHVCFLDEIFSAFPDAYVIHMIRDARDVASSFVSCKNIHRTDERYWYIYRRALQWNMCVSAGMKYGNDARVKNVFYRDLVLSPESMMNDVMHFVGGVFNKETLHSFDNVFEECVLTEEHDHKKLCAEGRIVNRESIWKKRLVKNECWIVNNVCRNFMEKLGFERQDVKISAMNKCSVFFEILIQQAKQCLKRLCAKSKLVFCRI